MKRSMILVLCVVMALVMGNITHAAPIAVPATGVDFNALTGGLFTAVYPSPLVTDFSGGHLSAQVLSQVYTNGSDYLYLYQLENTGGVNQDVITRFTTSPYTSANSQISLGYLTANIPADFSAGDQAPLYGDVDPAAGPTVGFNFPIGYTIPGIPGISPGYTIPDSYIAPGKDSKVLFVQSHLPPALVIGNVINGGVHAGAIYGPVPEPSTLVLLVTAGLGLVGYAWRRRRS